MVDEDVLCLGKRWMVDSVVRKEENGGAHTWRPRP